MKHTVISLLLSGSLLSGLPARAEQDETPKYPLAHELLKSYKKSLAEGDLTWSYSKARTA